MTEYDHKKLIASLSETQRASVLEKSDRAGLLHLGLHLGAITVCSTILLLRLPFYQAALLPQGILIVFLFTTLHETIHKTAFRSEWLNDLVAGFCGFLVFLPPTWFRYFHFAHHRYTHDPDRDPELATDKPGAWGGYLLMMTGLPDWVSRIRTVFRNAFTENSDSFVPPKGRTKVRREALAYGAAYGAVGLAGTLFAWNEIVLIWLLPLLIGGPFLRAYLLAEHTLCPHVGNMLHNTRTTFTNAIVRFVAWNMPYHIEHHSYPSVPFHKLPEFHVIAKQHLGTTENGYVRFNHTFTKTFGGETKA